MISPGDFNPVVIIFARHDSSTDSIFKSKCIVRGLQQIPACLRDLRFCSQSDFCEVIDILNVLCSPAAHIPGDADDVFACWVKCSFLPECSFVKAFVMSWESPSSSQMSSAPWSLLETRQERFCRNLFEEERF